MPDTNDSTNTQRSRSSIGRPMRVLLIVFIGAFAVWIAPTARHRMLVAELESLGATVHYDEQPCSILQKCLFGRYARSPVAAVHLSPTKPLNNDDLALLASFPELTELYLDGPHITDNDMRHVGNLAGLEVVGFNSTNITGHELVQLQGVDSLEKLYVCGVTVTADMLRSIGTLNSLRELGFAECEFESSNFGTLASLPHLSGFAILDSPMREQPQGLDRLHTLESLGFVCVPVTDEVCEQIGRLTELRALSVWSTRISDAGLRYLSDLHDLESLQLQDQPVTDDGLTHLSELRRLETLNLGGTRVTDDGLVHLEGLPKLKWLDLGSSQVSDAGLEHLSSIESLKYVFLEGSQVSPDGIAEVRRLLESRESDI